MGSQILRTHGFHTHFRDFIVSGIGNLCVRLSVMKLAIKLFVIYSDYVLLIFIVIWRTKMVISAKPQYDKRNGSTILANIALFDRFLIGLQ